MYAIGEYTGSSESIFFTGCIFQSGHVSCGFIEFEGAHECAGFDTLAYDDGFQCARIIFGTDFYRLGISGAVCRWFGSIEGIIDGGIALCAECRFYTAFGFIYRVFAFNFEYMFGVVEPHYIVDSKDMPDIIEEPVITFVLDLIPLYFAQCCQSGKYHVFEMFGSSDIFCPDVSLCT